ncbi:MAG TPA: M17 family peptidase N-terminal domain-containing protein, partial [Ilumatobacteraceae bacterium]
MTADVRVVRTVPKAVDIVGVPVGTRGAVPRGLGLNRAALAAHGFDGKPGQTLVVPSANGPTQIAVGIGDDGITTATLRNAAAALVRAAGKRTSIATTLADVDGVEAGAAAQAVVEGALLAAYRYHGLKTEPATPSLQELALVVGERRTSAAEAGVGRGLATTTAANLARDLANTPPAHLTARMIADKAVALGGASGLGVEVFNKDQLVAMGCGG